MFCVHMNVGCPDMQSASDYLLYKFKKKTQNVII